MAPAFKGTYEAALSRAIEALALVPGAGPAGQVKELTKEFLKLAWYIQ